MMEYAASLVVISAVISLAILLAYKEEASGGALRMAFSVLLLYVTVTPLFGAVEKFDWENVKFEVGEYDFEEKFSDSELTSDAFCRGVCLMISDAFSLNTSEVLVSVEGFDVSSMRAEKITVILSGDAVRADYRAIKEKVEKNGLGDCEVKIEI